MLQSSNQNCNTLQSIIGVFLKSCNAPETVCEFLAHAGLSLSTTSINTAVTNLSREVGTKIRELGRSFLASYAYDNLDIDLKHSVPMLEKSQQDFQNRIVMSTVYLVDVKFIRITEVMDLYYLSTYLGFIRDHRHPRIPLLPAAQPRVWGKFCLFGLCLVLFGLI